MAPKPTAPAVRPLDHALIPVINGPRDVSCGLQLLDGEYRRYHEFTLVGLEDAVNLTVQAVISGVRYACPTPQWAGEQCLWDMVGFGTARMNHGLGTIRLPTIEIRGFRVRGSRLGWARFTTVGSDSPLVPLRSWSFDPVRSIPDQIRRSESVTVDVFDPTTNQIAPARLQYIRVDWTPKDFFTFRSFLVLQNDETIAVLGNLSTRDLTGYLIEMPAQKS
ncbi:MAG: hypothetical protein HYY50_03915 [Candidatus Kerfeldbacteria bacterium]|nr:hypothetical protein [Candidatus Kerfeldbacteria bacterium]